MTESAAQQASQVLYEDTLQGGCHWSIRMARGTSLRITDLEGGANVGMLFYNPENLLERYNAPDTLKCQHTFKLTRGHCLYSDMGRIFCSITDDSVGWHDTVSGNITARMVEERWGRRNYQEDRNDWHQNGFEMDTLVLMHTCPHPLNMAADYPQQPVSYQIRKAPPVDENDECMNACPENQRGFMNNRIYYLGRD